MPRRSSRTVRSGGTERLGPVLHRLRTERSIPASRLSKETGLSPSYLNYLERGRFGDVGIEKFARLVRAMQLSADQVLAEAGYLPRQTQKLPDLPTYLRSRYKLSPADLDLAIKFLEFLANKPRRRHPKSEKEPRR